MASKVTQIHGIAVEVLDGILDMTYLVEDYQKPEGLIERPYQISNNFCTREEGRQTIALILTAHTRMMEGNYDQIPVSK